MRTGKHLSDGLLRALEDGELSPLASLRCALHLSRCAECRAARAAERRLRDRARELLALIERPVNVDEGWSALTAVRRDAAEPRRRRLRFPAAQWVLAVTAVVAAATLFVRPWTSAEPPRADGAVTNHRDICCWDLDGGGPGDDGVMTLSRAGEQLDCVVLYDDRDGSRSLTRGDIIRYVSRPTACGLGEAAIPYPADGAVLARLAVAR